MQKGNFTPDNDVKSRQFFYLQHEELARAMGVEGDQLPVILDALGAWLYQADGLLMSSYLSLTWNRMNAAVDEGDEKAGEATLAHPLRKRLHNYMEFYMTPSKHAAYAATWCVRADNVAARISL